ncbi:hypothetical protein [Nocardia miyunensis]|nr:hypothetical protein [Nocardia miyunensis]
MNDELPLLEPGIYDIQAAMDRQLEGVHLQSVKLVMVQANLT